MYIKDLMKKPLPQIPREIAADLIKSEITGTSFEHKNSILSDSELQTEVGYKKMSDGTYLVSMVCPMPGITPEMIDWWFWWHPQAKDRYKVWFPGAHFGIGYCGKQKDYFQQSVCPPFQNNTQYPLEKIGKAVLPLRIDFVTPGEFGFSEKMMEENGIKRIVCGHVGAFNNLVRHTEMAHIFRETENGLFMISRFWLGKTMKSSLLRKIIINEGMARDMAEHCCMEYRNLCEILPLLYEKYK
ncbi:MAG: hypothetical protein E7544_08280 [Ruminococcaceae bacterium]|nr:hypothetical protein [Oscillospiraceae bacterium]